MRTAALRTSPFGLEKFALRKPIVASTEKPGSPSLTTPNFGMICSINWSRSARTLWALAFFSGFSNTWENVEPPTSGASARKSTVSNAASRMRWLFSVARVSSD